MFIVQIIVRTEENLYIMSPILVSNKNIICGGDFNCVQNSLLDKYGSGANFTFGCEGENELNSMCTNFNLVDIFRKLNPNSKAIRHENAKDIHTRINRIYVSRELLSSGITFQFFPISFSDHDI